jgi:hypothetical protein
MPLKHDRDIASVVILVSVNNVELRTCQLIIRYSGSGVNLGYFDVITDIYGREHFRLDNIGNYPRTSAGHELVGATIICDVGNPIDSERDGYTRFRTIRVDYN